MDAALTVFIVAVVVFLYVVPGVVASLQGTQNQAVIWVVNIFAGWTVIGWVGALVWACVDKTPKQIQAERERQAWTMAQYMYRPPAPVMMPPDPNESRIP